MSETSEGEVGAVVLRAGSRYVTFGSVPEPDSLEILRVEKLPSEWILGEWEAGDTTVFPIEEGTDPLTVEQYPEEEAREYLERFAERNGFQTLRENAARRNIETGQNPTTQDIIDAYISKGAWVGELKRTHSEQPVEYNLMELWQGIEEADGPAAAEAMGVLESRVQKLQKKMEVVEDYQAISDGDTPHDSVQEVADEHGVSWRTVHRYVDQVPDGMDGLGTN